MGPFCDGPRIVVVLPISVKDPDEALHRVCQKAYGKAYKFVSPLEYPEHYESAYETVTRNLDEGEALTVLERQSAKVTFYTPKKAEKAWSAWIRVVDVTPFIYN